MVENVNLLWTQSRVKMTEWTYEGMLLHSITFEAIRYRFPGRTTGYLYGRRLRRGWLNAVDIDIDLINEYRTSGAVSRVLWSG
jgi:hypothetical protein